MWQSSEPCNSHNILRRGSIVARHLGAGPAAEQHIPKNSGYFSSYLVRGSSRSRLGGISKPFKNANLSLPKVSHCQNFTAGGRTAIEKHRDSLAVKSIYLQKCRNSMSVSAPRQACQPETNLRGHSFGCHPRRAAPCCLSGGLAGTRLQV